MKKHELITCVIELKNESNWYSSLKVFNICGEKKKDGGLEGRRYSEGHRKVIHLT